MNNQNGYTISEKSAIINVLKLIMEADNTIHPKEIEYTDKIMSKFQILIVDLDHMEQNDLHQSQFIIQGMSQEKRIEAKKMFSEMATVDGFVDSREQYIINNL